MIKMKTSEKNFMIMVGIFIFGLLNIFPNKISIYDQYIIPFIQNSINPSHIFYSHITFLIILFRLIIIFVTLFEAYKALNYGIRWNVFGLNDLLTKITNYFSR